MLVTMARSKSGVTSIGDNRSRLLRLSADLFVSEGYAHVSLRDLARRLDLTTGAIYSNFRSKGDLLAEVLEVCVREDMERDVPDRDAEGPGIALPDFVRRTFRRLEERRAMRALLLEAAAAARSDTVLRSRLRPSLDTLLERWVADYRDWQHARKVDRHVDMNGLVRSLWSIELGLGVLEAQEALLIAPEGIATFVGDFLGSLEDSDGPRRSVRPPASAPPTRRPSTQPVGTTRSLVPLSGLRDSPQALATQTRLIETALELFTQQGYAVVTVRDLARAASMTTGSIYGNFSNKANLLIEVIEARIAEDLEHLPSDLVASASPADLVEFNFAATSNRQHLRALVVEGAAAARSDGEIHTRLAEVHRRHLQAWADGLQEWVAQAAAKADVDTMTAVTVAWCAELGLGLMEALDLQTPTPRALADTFGSMFRVAGLGELLGGTRRRGTGGS
jgi:AcrR family transcriptional regulator